MFSRSRGSKHAIYKVGIGLHHCGRVQLGTEGIAASAVNIVVCKLQVNAQKIALVCRKQRAAARWTASRSLSLLRTYIRHIPLLSVITDSHFGRVP